MSLRNNMKNWLTNNKTKKYLLDYILNKLNIIDLPNDNKINNNILVYNNIEKILLWDDINKYVTFSTHEIDDYGNIIEFKYVSIEKNNKFIINHNLNSTYLIIQIDLIDENNNIIINDKTKNNITLFNLNKNKIEINLNKEYNIKCRILKLLDVEQLQYNTELRYCNNFDYDEFIDNYISNETAIFKLSNIEYKKLDRSKFNTNSLQLFQGGCLAYNNKIYFSPYDSDILMSIDCKNYNIEYFGNVGLLNKKYINPIQCSDGYIYFCPNSANNILKLNPIDNTYTILDDEYLSNLSGDDRWFGFILGKDDNLYGIPKSSNYILKYDFKDNMVSFIGPLDNPGQCSSACISPLENDNNIYFFPTTSRTSIIKLNIIDKKITYINTDLKNIKITGVGVLGDSAYCSVWDVNTCFYKFDFNTQILTKVKGSPGTGIVPMWNNCKLLPDGNFYVFPSGTSDIINPQQYRLLKINPKLNTISQVINIGSNTTRRFSGAIIGPINEIILTPLNPNTGICIIKNIIDIPDKNYLVGPYICRS